MRKLFYILLAMLAFLPLSAQKQEEKDSLIWLMSAKSAKLVDVEGGRYRQVIGPARFLHNGTYLLCDTALWNMETKIIDAWGNVSILQEETVLTSDNLKYLIDQDLAQFRGSTVQLTDKDHNTLRTRHLDYNTKDSVAVFMGGASMRDKDGQIIESRNGTYDSKAKMFTFEQDVNMFTDSIFVKTKKLIYESDLNLATFGAGTDAWQDDNMLSSEKGWYDRENEIFLFYDNVHVMTPDQEGWADSLYFFRIPQDVEMLGHAQFTDTTRNVFALAGRIQYQDSISKMTLTRDPAVITQTEEQNGSIDTVYLGSDKLTYYTVRMCDIPESYVNDSKKRLKDLDVDPVGEFRKKAAASSKASSSKASESRGSASQPISRRASAAPPQQDSLKRSLPKMLPGSRIDTSSPDSLAMGQVARPNLLKTADSAAVMTTAADTSAVSDSVAAVIIPPDTTEIGFLEAIGKVRIYKKDMQVVCDSLVYSDLDSLARLFKNPMIWQEKTRQYVADSITVVISDGAMQKASLMSNAFITIQEDRSHFDQIKATEMLAFFDEDGALKRFDALGGASALFFIEENETLATVNKTESKMLSATFKNGEIQRIYYYDAPKNDGYPVVQLAEDDKLLKGFKWEPEKRPKDRNAVTPLSLRPSERRSYSARPKATFRQTDIYFPGYMNDVYRQIEVRDSLRAVRERERQLAEARASELAKMDSLAMADTLKPAEEANLAPPSDSLSLKGSKLSSDILPATDSLSVSDTPVQIDAKAAAKAEKQRVKAEKKAAREAVKKEKLAKKEAHWAELDKRDAEKAAAKAAKRLAKERENKRKALEDAARQVEKDAQTLEKYRQRYEKEKARNQK